MGPQSVTLSCSLFRRSPILLRLLGGDRRGYSSEAISEGQGWGIRSGKSNSHMDCSVILSDLLVTPRLCSATAPTSASFSALRHHLHRLVPSPRGRSLSFTCPVPGRLHVADRFVGFCRPSATSGSGALMANSVPPKDGVYTIGDFMTKKEDLHVVKTTTTVDEALEALVENRITGFPVIDDDWKLVGLVSDYDLLALDSISGGGRADTSMFPDVDSTWNTFNKVQKLLSKTNGKVIGDVMTPAPLVVHESTNLEDAARLLLETKYRRLPVVDSEGKLVGIITRGNVVRAALQIKHACEKIA